MNPERKAKWDKWRKEEAQKVAETKSRLEREFGFENHPKRDKLWDLAWSHGHASGFSEVECYYREFAELL